MFKHKIWIVIVLILVVVSGNVFANERKDKPTIRSLVIRYGAVSTEMLKKFKDIGINYITIYNIYWGGCEKEPGKYDFSAFGEILNMARSVGLKAIIRLGASTVAPIWVWTYGKEQIVSNQERYAGGAGGKGREILKKLSVYPAMDSDGNFVGYGDVIDPWDATGNFLKCRYIAKACHYLQDNYSDVVEFVDAGYGGEGGMNLGTETLTATWAPTALNSYGRYLQEIYMNVNDVNKLYKTNWKSFWEAVPPKTYEDTKYFWDWHKWFERGMTSLFMRESEIVRRAGFKVSVLSHFVGATSRPAPLLTVPNPAALWLSFKSPDIINKIDADLYVMAGGFNNLTWRDEFPFDPYNKNPLVLVPYDTEILRKKKQNSPEALFIMEDAGGNPVLAEYIGLDSIDGFQVLDLTFSELAPEGKTGEQMFEIFKDTVQTFFIWKEKK